MIFAETIQFTPEQGQALMTALMVLIACLLLFLLGFFLSVVAGVRSGADPRRTASRVYWAVWIGIELVLTSLAVNSGELVWIGVVGAMFAMTAGAQAFGRAFLRRDDVTPSAKPPEASRQGHQDPAGPGSRP